jgi:hypothetical protein
MLPWVAAATALAALLVVMLSTYLENREPRGQPCEQEC